MKRIVLLLFCGACLASEMLAQNSRHGWGLEVVTGGVFSKPGSFGLSAKYQFDVSGLFRVEPYYIYYVSEWEVKKLSMYDDSNDRYPRMTLGANIHTLFYRGNSVRTYLVTGVSYSAMRYKPFIDEGYYFDGRTIFPDEYELGENKFGGNFGLGLDCRISEHLDFNIELGYNTATKEFSRMGFVYNF